MALPGIVWVEPVEGGWVEIEAAEVEVDGVAEALAVAEPAGG
jgi:hypothetical protein